MDRTELAWAAGFWDGEGSAWLTQPEGRGTAQPRARINQSSPNGVPQVLLRFQRAIRLGKVTGPTIADGKEPLYRWVVSSRADVLATYIALRPWLGPVKRSQFQRVLELDREDGDALEGITDEEGLAWAAGLFDGEGSVYLAKHRSHPGYFRAEAAITQSDGKGMPFVLTRFRAITSLGFAKGPYPAPPGHDPVYRWKLYRATDVQRMITMIRPWLGAVKRDQADHVISIVNSQPPLPRGNPAWGNRKTHCVNGHEYATARIRPFRSRGKNPAPRRASKQCLACARDHARRKRSDKKRRAGSDRVSGE
jgi:hypothetical protein